MKTRARSAMNSICWRPILHKATAFKLEERTVLCFQVDIMISDTMCLCGVVQV